MFVEHFPGEVLSEWPCPSPIDSASHILHLPCDVTNFSQLVGIPFLSLGDEDHLSLFLAESDIVVVTVFGVEGTKRIEFRFKCSLHVNMQNQISSCEGNIKS